MIKLFLLFIFCFVILSCNKEALQTYNNIEIGMTKNEVDSIAGKPKQTVHNSQIISYYDINDFNGFYMIITYSNDSIVLYKEMVN